MRWEESSKVRMELRWWFHKYRYTYFLLDPIYVYNPVCDHCDIWSISTFGKSGCLWCSGLSQQCVYQPDPNKESKKQLHNLSMTVSSGVASFSEVWRKSCRIGTFKALIKSFQTQGWMWARIAVGTSRRVRVECMHWLLDQEFELSTRQNM